MDIRSTDAALAQTPRWIACRVVPIVATFLLMAAPCSARAQGCDAILGKAASYRYITELTQKSGDKIVRVHTLEDVATRTSDGAVEVKETNPADFQGPKVMSIKMRDGFERSRHGDGRPIYSIDPTLGMDRDEEITPNSASLASDADFDVTITTRYGSRDHGSAQWRAHLLGRGSVVIGGCNVPVVRWELVSTPGSRWTARQEIVYAPDLRIMLSKVVTTGNSRRSFIVTDVTEDTPVEDIGFPLDVPLPFGGGLPFPPTGAVASFLNAKGTSDDCTTLRQTKAPFVLSSHVRVKTDRGMDKEELPFQRVTRSTDDTVELVERLGRERGRNVYRHGFLVRSESEDKGTVAIGKYDGLSAQTLAARKDVDVAFRSEVTRKGIDHSDHQQGVLHLKFEGARKIRLGICYFEALAFAISPKADSPKRKWTFLYSPDLGIRLAGEIDDGAGHGRKYNAVSVTTNTMSMPGVVDPVPRK